MKLSDKSHSLMFLMSLLTQKPKKEIKDFFDSLFVLFFDALIHEEEIDIPLIGKLKLIYEGDEITKDGLKAKIKADIELSDFFKKNAGLFKDKNNKNEIYKIFERKIINELKNKI